ncbi:MAG TPA: asparagine synthase (glutamine-hydrolyzing) [Planctomycetota bacterium]|nr:asparagine synthase (glutamine-hydrolyzing) [Planctomycetota bacterium]
MCGICGFVGPRDRPLLEGMTWDLRRRGPDSAGFHEDAHASLGHRRLAIIDLATGDQPLGDGPGRPLLVYNGELYNYKELRAELVRAGDRFRTASDTEVVLRAFERWGQDGLARLNGIFAFAVWEPARRRMTLVRDHLGIKPLRYRIAGERLYFASETRALFRTPGFRRMPRARAVDALLALRYEPEGDVFEDSKLLPPGHCLVFEGGKARITKFWEPRFGGRAATLEEDARRFEELFEASVKGQLVSDVPLGFFLSGGLDSSAVLDAARRSGARELRTFSIGFGTERDETSKAARVAAHYGARHETILLKPAEFGERLPEVFSALDEPVLDAIQVATYTLAEAASREVKVVLTGDGSDETLAGYVHHQALTWAGLLRRLVAPEVAQLLGTVVRHLPVSVLEPFFPYPEKLGATGREKVARLVEALGSPVGTFLETATLLDAGERARVYTADFRGAVAAEPSLGERIAVRLEAARQAGARRIVDRVLGLDLACWLPNNILMKLDRLTMAHGLEGRVPFLDIPLVEHVLGSAWKGPPHKTKILLRRAFSRRLPPEIARQPKQSFYFPIEASLGPAYEALARDVLSPEAVRSRGILEPRWVESLLALGSKRELVHSKRLFAAVALEVWFRGVVDPSPPELAPALSTVASS